MSREDNISFTEEFRDRLRDEIENREITETVVREQEVEQQRTASLRENARRLELEGWTVKGEQLLGEIAPRIAKVALQAQVKPHLHIVTTKQIPKYVTQGKFIKRAIQQGFEEVGETGEPRGAAWYLDRNIFSAQKSSSGGLLGYDGLTISETVYITRHRGSLLESNGVIYEYGFEERSRNPHKNGNEASMLLIPRSRLRPVDNLFTETAVNSYVGMLQQFITSSSIISLVEQELR
jgi:hypothetical protein